MKNTQLVRVMLEANYMNKLDIVTKENTIPGYYLQSMIAAYQEETDQTIIKMAFVKEGEQK